MLFLEDLPGYKNAIGNGYGCIVAIDYGSKNSGIAVSTDTMSVAMPLFDVLSVDALNSLKRYDGIDSVKGFVVGLPKLKDGSGFHAMARDVIIFGNELVNAFGLPVLFWDERMSTTGANRIRVEEGRKYKSSKRLGKVNSLAAQYILEGVLMSFRQH